MNTDEIMRERFRSLLDRAGPKHWSFAARKDHEFLEWVDQKTREYDGLAFAERVYAAVSGEPPVCPQGGRRSLGTILTGWRFCGKAATCLCAAKSVSEKCRAAHERKTTYDYAEMERKRKATNLKKYGVVNGGQTERARAAHQDFYRDHSKVEAAVARGRQTMLERHGVENAFQLDKVKQIRPLIAGRLSDAAKASRREKRRKLFDSGRYVDLSYERLKAKFEALGYNWLTPRHQYSGIYGDGREKFPFQCKVCDLEFVCRIYDGARPMCPSCHPVEARYESNQENEVADFVASLGFRVERPRNRLLGKWHIDIYCPDMKVAIEYGGLYWHSELSQGRGKWYHRNKLDECEAKGITLITIFSDEWINSRAICESRLRHLLGASSERRAARDLELCDLTHQEAVAFLNEYHIQGGGTPASVRIGLKTKHGLLVAVMTLGSKRRTNNHKAATGTWELYRFATRGSIIGGASKLFQCFLRSHSPTEIVTFADRRWGSGRFYEKLGFEYECETDPSYWYVERYTNRHYRFNFRKDRLVAEGFDSSKTEWEIMISRGFDRIWDCGNSRFLWRR